LSRKINGTQMLRKKIKRRGQWFVYIVMCRNGTYYTGYTNDLGKRITVHNSNKGAKYLRGKGPVTLVYKKEYVNLRCALKKENEIKNLTRKQKEKLVEKYAQKRKINNSG